MVDKIIYRGRSFDLIEEEVPFPDGRVVTRATVRHPGAVVILPQDSNGKILAIRQFRPALRKMILELPAGTLEPGELPRACAEREIVEEVGMRAAQIVELGQLYPAPGFCSEVQHLYYATDLTPAYAPGDDDELIEVVPLSVSEIEQAIVSGDFADAKSIALFTRAKLSCGL